MSEEKHYLKSWGYNEGRKLRTILRNIKNGNLTITSVRVGHREGETIIETEGELKI